MNYAAPYIGVAAPTSLEEVKSLKAIVDELGWPQKGRRLQVGPLVSYRVFAGLVPNKAQRYPPLHTIREMLLEDPHIFNVVHYNSPSPRLADELEKLVTLLSVFLHGFQLNVVWPEPSQLRQFRKGYPWAKLILQVGSRALEERGATPTELATALRPYAGLVEYVLIDPSGGTNTPFEVAQMKLLLEGMVEAKLPMKFGVTGGLNAGNLDKLKPLLEIYPQLSWDAESGLRTKDDTTLDPDSCYSFLRDSLRLVS